MCGQSAQRRTPLSRRYGTIWLRGPKPARGSGGYFPRHQRFLASATIVLVLAGLVLAGCGSTGPYVWVDQVAAPPDARNTFVIVPGDILAINVYNDERISGPARVRSDGYITLMLIGDVLAVGKTPSGLATELQTALSKYLNSPTVAVRVETEEEISVAFLGEVESKGVVKLRRGSGLLWGLSLAGGLSEYADWDSVYVIRQHPAVKVRFSFYELVANDKASNQFPLLDGDVVYVE